ncbi:MAG: hypothetical protein IJ753_02555 [Bacteroidales bacterium]|nr:hypothetical protein [Bacteroidales bacterium]MBQ9701402.1 hypothetical protein [Bacteroidales bacterium]MBR1782385.1 hypothetical protein [Bacteroidales bacterium]
MKRLFITLLLGTVLLCQAAAQNTSLKRHQVRIGWGDMLFETLAFHAGGSRSSATSQTRDYRYTGHIFADYRYSLNKLISLGVQTDFQGIFWKEGTAPSNNYDLSILPTIRFTYFRSEWVELYSGAAIGLLLAFDNARHWEAAPVICLNPFGVQFGKGAWTGSVELSPLTALNGANKVYMLGSRIFSLSVNYRW